MLLPKSPGWVRFVPSDHRSRQKFVRKKFSLKLLFYFVLYDKDRTLFFFWKQGDR